MCQWMEVKMNIIAECNKYLETNSCIKYRNEKNTYY